MPDLTILHTNDLHNRLDVGSASLLTREKQSSGAILLDGGDAVWAGNMYYRPGGEPILQLMSDAGYDGMALGNREFHFTESGLKSKIGRASFTVLCANIRSSRGSELPCRPYVILERGDVRLGVLGVSVEMVRPGSRTAAFSAYVFDPPVAAACQAAEELRPLCDCVVAVTHIGLKKDQALAEVGPGIDMIIGGHSHDVLNPPLVVNGIPVVQAGYYAHYYGHASLDRSSRGWNLGHELKPLRRAIR